MEFFAGFRWAVPVAFSDAVSLCRFEEGDVLYDTQEAYNDEWRTASKDIGYALQVRYPVRVAGVVAQGESGIFARNWNSAVRVDVYRRLEKVGVGQVETTQGRLFTALWKGDVGILTCDAVVPQAPIAAQQVTRSLGEVAETAKGLSNGNPVFAVVRDLSNPISREKYSKVFSKLKKHLGGEPALLSPRAAGLRNWAITAPTIDIAFFQTTQVTADELHQLVKEAVYVPAKNAKKEMFRIAAHGAIFQG